MDADDFCRIALNLEGAEEGSHMGSADFRVGGRTLVLSPRKAPADMASRQAAAFVVSASSIGPTPRSLRWALHNGSLVPRSRWARVLSVTQAAFSSSKMRKMMIASDHREVGNQMTATEYWQDQE